MSDFDEQVAKLNEVVGSTSDRFAKLLRHIMGDSPSSVDGPYTHTVTSWVDLDDEDIVRCEGCETLLNSLTCYHDVEGCALCEECKEIATPVRWDGEDWVEVTDAG